MYLHLYLHLNNVFHRCSRQLQRLDYVVLLGQFLGRYVAADLGHLEGLAGLEGVAMVPEEWSSGIALAAVRWHW